MVSGSISYSRWRSSGCRTVDRVTPSSRFGCATMRLPQSPEVRQESPVLWGTTDLEETLAGGSGAECHCWIAPVTRRSVPIASHLEDRLRVSEHHCRVLV